MKNCQNCGSSERMTAHIVEECGICGQEQHDYETLDKLRHLLAAHEAARRRLDTVLRSPDSDSVRVLVADVKEAMLLEHELFPIGGNINAIL